jgi:hypothetical protein
VLITIPTLGEPLQVQAEVRHWQTLEGNLVEVGCRFESPLVQEEGPGEGLPADLTGFVTRLVEKHQTVEEHRVTKRVPYKECISVRLPSGEVVRGFARDLSRGGIAFFTTASLPHEVVLLSLPQDDEGAVIGVMARIVRCTRLIEGFHEVAAQFLPT